ncbi:unnamed protein product [Fusarium langsethiae]|nr:unnamed protein product [Fusarium langsethiae]
MRESDCKRKRERNAEQYQNLRLDASPEGLTATFSEDGEDADIINEDIPVIEEPAAMPVGDGHALNETVTLTQDIHFGEYPSDAPREVSYRMLVSSSHLVLASPVFQAMVEGPYAEGSTDHRGIYRFATHGWNQEALVIVLDIIHGHHRSVPKLLDLEMLAKVAVIVDYYKCHEIVEVFAERWLKALQKGRTDHYGKASMLWLLISWVFSCPEIFERMAGLALKHSTRLILAENVPIPGEILDRIDQERQGALSEIFTTLYGLLDTLQHRIGEKWYPQTADRTTFRRP